MDCAQRRVWESRLKSFEEGGTMNENRAHCENHVEYRAGKMFLQFPLWILTGCEEGEERISGLLVALPENEVWSYNNVQGDRRRQR